MSDPNPQQGIKSVEIGKRVLVVLASTSGATTLGDIANRADMARAKAHRHPAGPIRTGMMQLAADGTRSRRSPAGPIHAARVALGGWLFDALDAESADWLRRAAPGGHQGAAARAAVRLNG